MHNKGEREFNVTHVGAHLHPQHEFSYFIQNVSVSLLPVALVALVLTYVCVQFTVQQVRGVSIGPGEVIL